MIYHLSAKNNNIKGLIEIGGSKSESNRLLILRAYTYDFKIENLSESDDTKILIDALISNDEIIDIHHSGTAMRFLLSYFVSKPNSEVILTGSDRMKSRPIRVLVNALRDLGANIEYKNKDGYPPLKIIGKKILKNEKSSLSCIINNAGIALGGPVRYLDVDIFRQQFEVNFFGLIEVTKCFLDLLIESNKYKMKNKIINVGSISGKRSYPFVAPYTSSKHALEGFNDALRRELLLHEIDVVLLEPGPIKTPIWDKTPSVDNNPFLGTDYESALRKFYTQMVTKGKKEGLHVDRVGELIEKVITLKKPRTR